MGKWISVKDRLPEDGQDVLIFTNGKTTVAKFLANGLNGLLSEIGMFVDLEIKGMYLNVYNWMSLPEPPEKE